MSGQSTEPTRGVATEAHAGRPCPYCRFTLKETVEIVQCGACGSIHHGDCWEDNAGCSIMACAGGPGERAATTGSIPAVPPPPAPVTANTQSIPVAGAAPAPPPYQPPASSGAKRGGLLLISAIILLALAISGVAVALVITNANTPVAADETDGGAAAGGASAADPEAEPTETASPEPTPEPTEEPAPEPTPSALPDEPRAQMRRDIRDMLLVWHENIVRGSYRSSWDLLTERKQRQNEREDGYSAWERSQASLGDYLDPSGIRVSILDLDDKTGVARVQVGGMYYSGPGKSCEWRGITWVRHEQGEWRYDPGYSTTPQREREWKNRFSELLGGSC